MKEKFLDKWNNFVKGISNIFNPFGNFYYYKEYNFNNLSKSDKEVLQKDIDRIYEDMDKVFADIDKTFETLKDIKQ